MVNHYANFGSRIFSEESLHLIENKIEEIEKTTSGEIVVVTVRSASPYGSLHLFWALGGWILVSAMGLLSAQVTDWTPSPKEFVADQAAAIVFGYLLAFVPRLKRLTLSRVRRQATVHQAALAKFAESGLHRTRQGTGILIYIAELEHQVEILADAGIHAKVEPGFWDAELAALVQGLRNRKPTEALLVVLDDMGRKLAANFPPDPENPNELSNRILST